MIDTHTHLYVEEFDLDRSRVIETAINQGVQEFWLPAIDSSYHDKMFQLEKEFPAHIKLMMGLHPCYVRNETMEQELNKVYKLIQQRDFIGIGEIGIDLYWDKTTLDIQKIAFEQQIKWAIEKKLPIIIHARESLENIIPIVQPYANKGLRGIFHCWSGTLEQAIEVTNMGFLLGIGGVITFKNGKINQFINQIDIKHLVLETDSPYLSPVPYRGKRNEPQYLDYIVKELSVLYQLPETDIKEITTKNAKQLLSSI